MRSGAAAAALLVVVAVALCLGSVRHDSATSDEPAHIANGVIKLSERWPGFFREQPPLMNSLSGLPLVLSGYRIAPGWKDVDHWVAGRRFLYRSGHDAYRVLFLARLPTMALFASLLVVMYWFILRQTGSPAWAVAALALTAFCPNLMAHGRLATVDLALAFFSFTATALLITLIERPTHKVGILFGIAAAAAPMSKVSGVVLGPFFVAVVVMALLLRRVSEPRRFLRVVGVAALSALLFFEVVSLAETSGTFARQQYPSTPRLLIPFAEYAANLRTINNWYAQGHVLPQFMLGQFSPRGWPEYYLVAFLLKTPIPAILLLVAALVAGARTKSFSFFVLVSFVVLFFAVSSAGHLALGVRYVLPVYPFIYGAIAISLSLSSLRRAGVTLVVALVAWHAIENVRTYPSYIAYFNQLIGNERNADKFLIDSNLDWGQDLRRLDAWVRDHRIRRIAVHYFGGGSVEYEMRSAKPIIYFGPGPGPLPEGYFALSRHFYRVSFDPAVWGVNYDDYLASSGAELIATVGGSINVYRVKRPFHSYNQ